MATYAEAAGFRLPNSMNDKPRLTVSRPRQVAADVRLDDSLIEPLTILLSQPGGKGAMLAAISGNISLLLQLGPDGELGPRPFPIRFQAQVALTRHGAVIRLAFAFFTTGQFLVQARMNLGSADHG